MSKFCRILSFNLVVWGAAPRNFHCREPPEEKTEELAAEKVKVTEDEEEEVNTVNLSPWEVVQTKVFYKIWLSQFAIALAQVICSRCSHLMLHFIILGSLVELEENVWSDLDHLGPVPRQRGDLHLLVQRHLQDHVGAPL